MPTPEDIAEILDERARPFWAEVKDDWDEEFRAYAQDMYLDSLDHDGYDCYCCCPCHNPDMYEEAS
jgi:hypothetical protein